LKRTVAALGQVMFAAGAVEVVPGVAGFDAHVLDDETMRRFAADGPDDPAAYSIALSHLFGTCRLGTRPQVSVVGPDFRHHTVDRLYVADASVFPTNLGVNPQISIMAMAQCCAHGIAKRSSAWRRRVPLVA
jgi:choline dehydrogenase-like flavoprotein